MNKNHNNNLFKLVSEHAPKASMPKTDEAWGWFLAGLIDSDGHMNKFGYLVIVFDVLNASCAYSIKRKVGYGTVTPVKGKNALTYVLSHRVGRAWVAKVTFNKLQLKSKIIQYNTRFVPPLGLPPSQVEPSQDITNNHWLAGFIQGDGSFQIIILNRLKGGKKVTEVRCVLQIDQSTSMVLKVLQNAFGGYVGYRKKQDTYYYSSVSLKNAVTLIHHLDTYQVCSGRLTAYWLWRRCYVKIQSSLHLTPPGVAAIAKMKAKLNAFCDYDMANDGDFTMPTLPFPL
jgi:LAGLIDADG endonuclease